MSGFTEKLEILKNFLSELTWVKIAQTATLCLVLFLAWITFQTRDDISLYLHDITHSQVYTQPLKKLSKKTRDALDMAVIGNDLITAIAVNVVDFKTNTRYVVYITSNNIALKNIYSSANIQGLEQPLFSNNIEQNRRIIDIINGEFICSKFSITSGSFIMPETNKYIDTVCANGIPPYFGKTLGVVSIFLKRQPTSEEIDQIRVITKNLSIMIYEAELK